MSENKLAVTELHKRYGEHEVLKGVSLEQLAQQTTDNFATLFHIDPARLQPA